MTPREHIDALNNVLEETRKQLVLEPNPGVFTIVDIAEHLIPLYAEQVKRWERYDRIDKLLPDFFGSLLAGAFLDRAGHLNPDLMLVWLKEREPGLFSWQQ